MSMPLLLVLVLAMPAAVCGHPRQLNESFREAQVNPSIVVIIIILTIIFFLSGCLHLLIRCLVMRHPRRDPSSIVTLTPIQGQLQQLFHLHDSGVEQAFIDTLPVFFYKSVTGLKEGADCAVCLCEFEGEDRLRLLPKCSHAFHMDCIDTWLLSHSNCPLCRRSLLPDHDLALNSASYQGYILESSRSSIDADAMQRVASDLGTDNLNSAEGLEMGVGAVAPEAGRKPCADVANMEGTAGSSVSFPEGHSQPQYAGKVFPVQLGRFRVVGGASQPDASSSITGSRRSYSVGSYEYVLDPCNLEVVIAPTPLHRRTGTPRRPTPGHRVTVSECADHVAPDALLTPFHEDMQTRPPAWTSVDINSPKQQHRSAIDSNQQDDGPRQTSRKAFSFRHPVNPESRKLKVSASRRSLSETEALGGEGSWSINSNASGTYVRDPSSFSGTHLVSESTELSYNLPSHGAPVFLRGAASAPYFFAKRTLNWLVGR
ncbi:hypothetical protein KP509_03G066200 [Ceratopteris richardii]|uniref:RING-type E3 ubiquitin transferase n=1 Tax=Ceratopteris richardii TaxID=49495 RepID=A0A8T2VC91_CERRI|nr:hypothetical protein KP509_03G066200 [Ceratopteris richardii]